MKKEKEKAIEALINSDKSILIAQGVNYHIDEYGLEKTKKNKNIKKIIKGLLESDDKQDKSRGIKLFDKLYKVVVEEQPFIKKKDYRILIDNAGLLTCSDGGYDGL